MRMLFNQDYATSTAMVAVATLTTMVMSVAEVATSTRLAVVVGLSLATMLVGNMVGGLLGARRRDSARRASALWDEDAS